MISRLRNLSKRRGTAAPLNGFNIEIARLISSFRLKTKAETARTARDDKVWTARAKTDEQTQIVQDPPESLDERYQAWLERDLSRLIKARHAIGSDITDLSHFKQLRLATHDLKGMATIYGYPAISRLANSLDKLLKTKSWHRQLKLIDLHIDACRAAANHAPASDDEIDEVSSAVCDALDAQVNQLTKHIQNAS